MSEPPPRLVGRSRRQQAVVDCLWLKSHTDPGVWMPLSEIRMVTGFYPHSDDINSARVKLRRMGWEIEGRSGSHGYRLVRWREGVKP